MVERLEGLENMGDTIINLPELQEAISTTPIIDVDLSKVQDVEPSRGAERMKEKERRIEELSKEIGAKLLKAKESLSASRMNGTGSMQ